MGLENSTTIGGLNAAWPLGTDPKSQGDDHLRLVKGVIKADAYGRSNVRDAVAMVGAVPTGGLIDNLVNADGTAIRWADGTMICHFQRPDTGAIDQASGALFQSADLTWTFPRAFITVPRVLLSAGRSGAAAVGAHEMINTTTTAAVFRAWSSVSLASPGCRVSMLAIGRWVA